MKRALVIRHVPVEGVAGFRAAIEAAGYAVDRIDVTDARFPETDLIAPDLVVMMGGPMGVYETDRYPWIACQVRRLGLRLAADRPTLGVCLGAQMMAAALGARVYPGGRQEVGFAPVTLNGAGAGSPLRHLDGNPMLHWHGDTFDLPEGTELLASTGLYAHQAFRRGPNILALQFHAEMGEDPRFDSWLEKWPDAIAAAGSSANELRAHHDAHGPNAVAAGRRMIAEWLEGLRG
ncbi:GMP synthase (glutamine-hydrolysing) [Sphingomonas laterariae]|uniref:GMP synthase (Glutamine-hydrolysing) n=1 Tax=Edaphosphingomonas laterariae TaxID=861865 RepID=A0A239BRG4_9SPHN|nr:glutamine amidotransferase [Sphingomonas laterariae]SNS10249.1 GMP synthase (glutamine-hydrolysing) [Sphingomonas laterariae]